MTDEELDAIEAKYRPGARARTLPALRDILALVAEVRRLRAYSASGTEHRAKAADAVQNASAGYFVSGVALDRKAIEEVVAIVDNVLLQERKR